MQVHQIDQSRDIPDKNEMLVSLAYAWLGLARLAKAWLGFARLDIILGCG